MYSASARRGPRSSTGQAEIRTRCGARVMRRARCGDAPNRLLGPLFTQRQDGEASGLTRSRAASEQGARLQPLIDLHVGETQPAAHIVPHHQPRDGDATVTQRDGDDRRRLFGHFDTSRLASSLLYHYACLSMLRYWSSLRYSSLRTLFTTRAETSPNSCLSFSARQL